MHHMESVGEASTAKLLDATVRRTDWIDKAETGGIAEIAARPEPRAHAGGEH